MKYLCMAYGDRGRMEALSQDQNEALMRDCAPYMEELKRSGRLLSDYGLSWETTSIRPRAGTPSVSDGPFAESKEQVGGFFVIEARDLNEAILVASRHPAAHLGEELGWGIDVRPIAFSGME